MPLEIGPLGKAVVARDGALDVFERKGGRRDLFVGKIGPFGQGLF